MEPKPKVGDKDIGRTGFTGILVRSGERLVDRRRAGPIPDHHAIVGRSGGGCRWHHCQIGSETCSGWPAGRWWEKKDLPVVKRASRKLWLGLAVKRRCGPRHLCKCYLCGRAGGGQSAGRRKLRVGKGCGAAGAGGREQKGASGRCMVHAHAATQIRRPICIEAISPADTPTSHLRVRSWVG